MGVTPIFRLLEIRYFKNENLPASAKIRAAKQFGLPVNKMLYSVHDDAIARYAGAGPVRPRRNADDAVLRDGRDVQSQSHRINDGSVSRAVSEVYDLRPGQISSTIPVLSAKESVCTPRRWSIVA